MLNIYNNEFKILNSPKHIHHNKSKDGQIMTSNYDEASINKIISIKKIKINPKYNSIIKNSEDNKKGKKIISISCSVKNQKE